MKTTILKALKANLFRGSIFSFILFMGCVQVVDAADTAKSWKPLQDFWGAPGWQEDGAWVLGFPRSDLNVMVKGVPLETALGLTSRFSFRPLTHGWAVRGRLVLLDQESRRVEKRLVRDGFQLEAFGGLLVGETPALKFLQFSGEGTSSILNAQLRNLLSLTGTPLTPHSFPAPSPGAQADWAPFQAALGQNGFVQGNVLWILPPPFTPTSDPAPGFLSMRFQKDGANLMVLGEMDPSLDRLSPLLKILAAHQMTVTSLRQGPAGAARVEWWGEAPEAGLVSALQKIIALAAPPLSDEKETASTKSPAPEGF